MNKQFNKEDLYHALPDYISSTLTDKELIYKISKEIDSDPEFRSEYENLSETLTFIGSTGFEGPEESYFNNLSVKINERIISEKKPENFFGRLGLAWRILIPAIPVLIVFLITMNFLSKDNDVIKTGSDKTGFETSDKNKNTDTPGEIVKAPESKIEKSKELNTDNSRPVSPVSKVKSSQFNKKYYSVSQNEINFENKKENLSQENINTDNLSDILSYNLSDNLADNIDELNIADNDADSDDEILLIKDQEEENMDEEILELTPEEENEILENLVNS